MATNKTKRPPNVPPKKTKQVPKKTDESVASTLSVKKKEKEKKERIITTRMWICT